MGGSEQRFWLTAAGAAGAAGAGGAAGAAGAAGVFRGPQLLTTLPSNMLKNGAGGTPISQKMSKFG